MQFITVHCRSGQFWTFNEGMNEYIYGPKFYQIFFTNKYICQEIVKKFNIFDYSSQSDDDDDENDDY